MLCMKTSTAVELFKEILQRHIRIPIREDSINDSHSNKFTVHSISDLKTLKLVDDDYLVIAEGICGIDDISRTSGIGAGLFFEDDYDYVVDGSRKLPNSFIQVYQLFDDKMIQGYQKRPETL